MGFLVPYLVKIPRACLAIGYVPATWRQIKVVFIPKPNRNSYHGPKDFRPISLTLFLLKTMDRLVDRFLRMKFLCSCPYIPINMQTMLGNAEIVLHQLVVRVEKALDQQETAVGVFLDIEGAFNNTSCNSRCVALAKHGVDYTIIWWTRVTLEG